MGDNARTMNDLDVLFNDMAPDDESVDRNVISVPNALAAPGKMAFDARLAFEVALGYTDVQALCKKYALSFDQWNAIASSNTFRQAVTAIEEDLQSGGATFKLKARILSEASLDTAWIMLQSNTTDAGVRARLIEWLGRVAGHDPKSGGNDGGQQNAFQININIGDG